MENGKSPKAFGDITNYYDRCGAVIFGMRLLCQACTEQGEAEGCGKLIVTQQIKGEAK